MIFVPAMNHPIIASANSHAVFPKRFLFAKIATARRLQGDRGEIVFLRQRPRPAGDVTILRDQHNGQSWA
jgi:hypothetical protein